MALPATDLLTMEPLHAMPSPKYRKATERIYKQFDKIIADSPYEWRLLDRYDNKKALESALEVHSLGKFRKYCRKGKIYGVTKKYYQTPRFNIRLLSFQKNKRFALYAARKGANAKITDESDVATDDEVNTDGSMDAPNPGSVVNKVSSGRLFFRWLSLIQNEDSLNSFVTSDIATLPVSDPNMSNDSTTVNDEPLNSPETAKGSSLERHIPEKWKLIDRFNDFTVLDKVRKDKDVHLCRMEVKDGITEKYYRCNSCNYKMWSRQKGDRCALYYSGQHDHPLEQLDAKLENPIPMESVTLNVVNPPKAVTYVVPIIVNCADPDTQPINEAPINLECASDVPNPLDVPKIMPTIVAPTDPDTQVINDPLANVKCASDVPNPHDVTNPSDVSDVVPIIVNPTDSKLVITEHVSKVKCARFSCYSLSCLTQISVEFGLELIIDDYNNGQFSLRKDDRLLKFVISEAGITMIFREYIDLEHVHNLPSMNWGQFLTDIRRKCSNLFVN
uniref:FLYWCH-type domain-containing protein n=1 Tax=Panagrellus redivivus TaxID=6233 RepID=A0A7E4VDV2_PANRE